MQNKKGFTLLEILISITIISILAAILIPNTLAPRSRAYDVATQSCLKEVSTRQLAKATQSPYDYATSFDPATVSACTNVTFSKNNVTSTSFTYEAKHATGKYTYAVSAGTGVDRVEPTSNAGNNNPGNGNPGNNKGKK